MAKLTERIGYGFGDMASSMFWKMFSFYLPFFYSNVYKLELTDAAMLVLITRIWDAVSDPMMGIVADRTRTRWGKYRPYLLFVAPVFSVCGILLFTTPEWEYGAKLVWAYITHSHDDRLYCHQRALWCHAWSHDGRFKRKDRIFQLPYVSCLRRLFHSPGRMGAYGERVQGQRPADN